MGQPLKDRLGDKDFIFIAGYQQQEDYRSYVTTCMSAEYRWTVGQELVDCRSVQGIDRHIGTSRNISPIYHRVSLHRLNIIQKIGTI